ncbi:MAG TPA: VWA domain-containing protein, partial [Tissierellia bacterium]|nr:VWA domain-containing protein [Tissierellia bacterium]
MNKFKKIISLVITLMMVLPSFQINVMADETIIEQVEEDNDLFLDDEIQLDDTPAEEINDDLPVEGTQDDDPPEEDVIDELPVEESQEDEINDGPILESSTDEQLDEPAEEINDEQADEENAEEEHKDDVQDVQIEEEQLQQFVSLAVMANYDELTPALEPQTDPDKLPPGTVAAEKTARWVDYSNRIAEINLSVEGMPIIFGSDVILVMDVSLSMDTNNRFNTAKNASIQFINGLLGDGNPLNNRVAFIPFHGSRNGGTGNSEVNSVTEGRVNFTYDIDLLTSQVNATSLGLYTNYSAALQKAIQYSNSRPVSERTRPLYIVFMSDGEPNPSSNNGVSQAITLKASPHNATIYTVGIQLTGNAPQALRNLASSVGGEELYKNVSNMNDLAPVLETIAGEIKVAGRNAFFKDYLSEYFDLYNAA